MYRRLDLDDISPLLREQASNCRSGDKMIHLDDANTFKRRFFAVPSILSSAALFNVDQRKPDRGSALWVHQPLVEAAHDASG